ncbi:hypothetical protein TREMEDRAFT_60743 [Tremella mesenterica DSM 1558]|uniref:uncharacterized protein n=1 Tax=Tremella mesenterica (strain ATCC 24925 / CBS 8224 / DSM 1558 / NBRC 9311 / NRRL Y-6157 / RJB 2259-6 / UBC 559-6) TaxID=578456 RepID=UPI0003F49895|nr:uncharacterized protein TREMEDRAFT_60743 [Tremella mesenterica DSM 1558]EIW71824.1 hypothetical protein TREMEDRAFT_60743 [Tremella mesenterica DSM 1558]
MSYIQAYTLDPRRVNFENGWSVLSDLSLLYPQDRYLSDAVTLIHHLTNTINSNLRALLDTSHSMDPSATLGVIESTRLEQQRVITRMIDTTFVLREEIPASDRVPYINLVPPPVTFADPNWRAATPAERVRREWFNADPWQSYISTQRELRDYPDEKTFTAFITSCSGVARFWEETNESLPWVEGELLELSLRALGETVGRTLTVYETGQAGVELASNMVLNGAEGVNEALGRMMSYLSGSQVPKTEETVLGTRDPDGIGHQGFL